MVQRRMFSKQITDMDTFLDMPATAQNLYFHLNMHADDDGFLGNVKTIRRMVGASEDDQKLLIAKQFLIMFPDGVVVIRDWHIHNYIQKDRYHQTIFTEDKKLLQLDSSKRYQILSNLSGNKMDTECIQNGYKMDTQDRGRLEEELGKDRLEEEDEEHHQFSSPSESINHFIATHQISFSKYQLQQINEFKQQLNDERLVVHAMKEAMSKNNDPKVELPFSYLVKILSRYVQEHVTYESLQAKITNTFRKSSNEQMPEWSKKSQEELCKKADSEVIRKLKERIANRGK
ncbi:DNA replication protein [Limosilactobacillus reuteri]|uniref:DNA replication protein n=1 Tax=Limosilactobacillus reuteri TaxID=1598 RepID=UPI0002D6871D|nr:DNA replication protein [Limosilactobacillus reuteri]MCC4331223.1 DNA replication protein [Limosilactobacillus reuteri]MCC4353535.1 DNA replication protein [Limosilactobacillus reuteri]MCH5358004.1 DNA replication protein [Limosilactobacillus reuteri]